MAESETQLTYNNLWRGQWGEMQEVGPVHRHITEIVVDEMRRLNPTSIVDVGCGNGANLAAIQKALGISNVVGLDVSDAAIESARRHVSGELIVRDIITEGPLDRQFDLVLTSQVAEHIEDDDAFFSRLFDMCGRYAFVGTMQGTMRPSELAIGHVRNYTRAGLEAKLRAAGFKVDKVIEWGFPFYSPIYRTLNEKMGGATHSVNDSKVNKLIGRFLYYLYKLNARTHGDVIMIVASRP